VQHDYRAAARVAADAVLGANLSALALEVGAPAAGPEARESAGGGRRRDDCGACDGAEEREFPDPSTVALTSRVRACAAAPSR
jgi:hypothetical protein